jgi:hypothetical protein
MKGEGDRALISSKYLPCRYKSRIMKLSKIFKEELGGQEFDQSIFKGRII